MVEEIITAKLRWFFVIARNSSFAYTAFHSHEKPIGSFITQVVQSGHKRHDDSRYLMRTPASTSLSLESEGI